MLRGRACAAGTGAALLWRMKENARLPVLEMLPDGSYRSVLIAPRITGAPCASPAGPSARLFPPEQAQAVLARVKADITRNKNLNPERRHRTCPRAIKRGRHNAYRVKKPGDKNMRHDGPATIQLANPVKPQVAA